MAWIERLPALIDPLAGVPDTWRARLEDGTPVAVLRLPEPDPARAGAALTRLRAIGSVRNSRLVRLLGAALDAGGVSAIYDADLGTGLERALQAGPIGAGAGVALANDVLEGLEALHAAGQAHGAVGEHSVRLYGDGGARLWAFAPEVEDAGGARTADVRAAAQLVCRALGLPLEWSASDPLRETERSAPALAATLRAVARGSLPLEATGARSAIDEAAGALLEEHALEPARAELAARAGAQPPSAAPRVAVVSLPTAKPSHRRVLITAAAAVGVVLLAGAGVLGWQTAGSRHPGSVPLTSSRHSPAPRAQPSASPNATPSLPPSAGDVRSVAETPQSTCSPGASCTIEVDVHFAKASAPFDVAWQFELVDSCTNDTIYLDGNHITAQAGWVHVIGDTKIRLPTGHPLAIVAITTTPSQAASEPLLITSGAC